jgi:hypothetical protein
MEGYYGRVFESAFGGVLCGCAIGGGASQHCLRHSRSHMYVPFSISMIRSSHIKTQAWVYIKIIFKKKREKEREREREHVLYLRIIK